MNIYNIFKIKLVIFLCFNITSIFYFVTLLHVNYYSGYTISLNFIIFNSDVNCYKKKLPHTA